MLPLNNIPEWMEQFIPEMTDNECKDKKDLDIAISGLKPWQGIVIVNLNAKIQLLENLKLN